MFVGTVRVHGRTYVRLLESVRVNGRPTHRVRANLGNVEALQANLPAILRGLHRVLGTPGADAGPPVALENVADVEWGVTLVARQLWTALGLEATLRRALRARRGAAVCPGELLVRTMVTNRLSDPTSKLGIATWLPDVTLGPAEDRALAAWATTPAALADRFYKAMDVLLRARPTVERALYARLRNLFSLRVDVVYYDVTSTYFEGSTAEWGRLGYSRDGRGDCLQVLVGLVLADGLPISHHVLRGDRRDATTLPVALADISRRFRLGRVILVADRGLLTADNLTAITAHGAEYILACRRRRSALTRAALRQRPAVAATATALQVWSTTGPDGQRLVGFHNPERATYDAERRDTILAAIRADLDALQASLARARALRPAPADQAERDRRVARLTEVLAARRGLGKRYFAAHLTPDGRLRYRVKQRVLAYEAWLDGTTLLITNNTTLADAEVVARYKELTRIEASFRDLKSLLDLRPIHHRRARRIAAHVFVCVLALLLEEVLERKLRAAGLKLTAAAALRELKRLRLLRDTVNGVEITRVSAVSDRQRQILEAVGVPVPAPLVWAERVAPATKARRGGRAGGPTT